jgi:predicted ferric reductase
VGAWGGGRVARGLGVGWRVIVGNAAAIVWLWVHGGNVTAKSSGDVLTSIARLTGLLSAYLALIQVVLLARIPALERLVGFARLRIWHRWNGPACLHLALPHLASRVRGYPLPSSSRSRRRSDDARRRDLSGMITATVGTVLLIAVVATSIVIVRRRPRRPVVVRRPPARVRRHRARVVPPIPTGNELVLDKIAADYWRALYVATIALLVVFRLVAPIAAAFRYRLRVAAVVEEGAGVVSLWITGRRLDRLRATAGQFFIWRFLTRDRWWKAHPFSLSAAPDGRSLRITVKALGDDTAGIGEIPIGTRVAAEGQLGSSRRRAAAVRNCC